jgi:hypothetical protein
MAQRILLQRGNDCSPRMRRRLQSLRHEGGCVSRVTTLAGSVEPLRQWFNRNSTLPRIIAIQSAT